MKSFPGHWLLSFLVVGVPVALSAGAPPGERVDQAFREWNKPGVPGVSVAVIQHGQIVYEKGFGVANLEYDIPVSPQTIFHVASVSKQFTAMALVLLELDGKLSLDDDARKYLPELPDYGYKLTIRQLLQHTSGIRDQWQTLALAGWRLDDVITQDQILRLLFRQKELNFPAGTRHLYSNGGYTLAAEIVARVSGKPLPAFCEERIFRPLGMEHTHFHLDHRRIVPGRAYSYEKTGEVYQALPLNYANVGATSLFTTASDLVKWLDNFRTAKVGGRAGVDRLQQCGVLADGQKIDYALGVALGDYRGLKTVSHGGGDAGYRSFVLWFPDHELGVAVLSGLASFNSGRTAQQVAEVFLEDKMTPKAAPAKTAARKVIPLETNVLNQYVGHYRLDAGLEADVVLDETKLFAQIPGQWSYELKPVGTNRFWVEELGGEVEVSPKSNGVYAIKFTQSGTGMNGERVSLEPAGAPDLSPYEGVYWSDELETQYTLKLKGPKLVAVHAHHGEISLLPTGKDQFSASEWFMPNVKFLRDASGQISGLTLGGGRVAAIRFSRK
ncbi:MAG TPA: serine hydrolase domain-containing protein [Verrucomicrobiae bacterium]